MTSRKSPLETASAAILDALDALGRIDPIPSHPVARAALYKVREGLLTAASNIDLTQIAMEPRTTCVESPP